MNEKALRTLEYTKIIERLTELAGSSIGKELCRNLKPSSNLAEIEAAQKQTSDALSRIYQRGSISFSGVQDVRGSLKRLEIGGSLSALELLRIAKLLETTSRVKSFGRLENSDREKDSLDDMFDGLQPLANLYNEIYRCILSEDEIADDASPALAKIRRSIRQTNDLPFKSPSYKDCTIGFSSDFLIWVLTSALYSPCIRASLVCAPASSGCPPPMTHPRLHAITSTKS